MLTPLTPSAARLMAACERIFPDQMAIKPTNAGGAHEVATIPSAIFLGPQPCAMLAERPVFSRSIPFDSRAIREEAA